MPDVSVALLAEVPPFIKDKRSVKDVWSGKCVRFYSRSEMREGSIDVLRAPQERTSLTGKGSCQARRFKNDPAQIGLEAAAPLTRAMKREARLTHRGHSNIRSGIKGPTGMYWWSMRCSFASGRVSMMVRASSSVFASRRKTTPLPSPREYHSRIFPSR